MLKTYLSLNEPERAIVRSGVRDRGKISVLSPGSVEAYSLALVTEVAISGWLSSSKQWTALRGLITALIRRRILYAWRKLILKKSS